MFRVTCARLVKTRGSPLVYDRALLVDPPGTAAVRVDGTPNTEQSALQARRWVRDPTELCVEHVLKSKKHLTDYVVTYKWNDPQWRPLLLLPAGDPVSLELRARHSHFALKHLAQKGHAMYCMEFTQHSVLHPKGLIDRSYVECSYPSRGERLVTNVIHEGPIDAAAVLSGSLSDEYNTPRGVVAVSQAQGRGMLFDRKEMLWKRSRRIGALQAEVGALDWELHSPQDVGRRTHTEVMLLAPHTEYIGGGLRTRGIISSIAMAQHPHHFVNEFEAPTTTVMDAIHQGCYLVACENELVRKDGSEQLHVVGGMTRHRYPFPPLENDLHFRLHISRPQVFHHKSEYPSSLIGAPVVDGAPVMMLQYCVIQGAQNYLYDEMPSSNPYKWWQQYDNIIAWGQLYCVRTGNLVKLNIFEEMRNPFELPIKKRAATEEPTMETRAEGGASAGVLGASEQEAEKIREYYGSPNRSLAHSIPPNEVARKRMRRTRAALARHQQQSGSSP